MPVFLVLKKEKKKKDRPVPFWLICSSPLPPSHFIFSSNKFELLWKRHIVYIQLLLRVVVNRGGFGQGTRNGTGSRSQSALIRDLSADDAGWQEESKKLEQIQHLQKQVACLFSLLCCSLFDVQHSRKLPAPASSSSVRLPGTRHKTTAGHQHCNFLTYNKAISYFLPYK